MTSLLVEVLMIFVPLTCRKGRLAVWGVESIVGDAVEAVESIVTDAVEALLRLPSASTV